MILPNSPRILISIAEKINNKNAIKAMINQDNIYDDIKSTFKMFRNINNEM